MHLLDGSLLSGSGSYGEFVEYIGGLYTSGDYTAIFETEANWQTSVTTYGVCGKFVYDSVNNTVRLPKVTGIIEGTVDVSALGDLVEAGLPNITGHFKATGCSTQDFSGAFKAYSKESTAVTSSYGTYDGVEIDASESNSIYGNSPTVQPQTIKAFYYIVIATSTKTDIQVDIDEIATDLNGKADVDLSNCTKPHIVETYVNGTSWYNIYSNGWCEQGGSDRFGTYSGSNYTRYFLKPFINTDYTILTTDQESITDMDSRYTSIYEKYTDRFVTYYKLGICWQANGYIS